MKTHPTALPDFQARAAHEGRLRQLRQVLRPQPDDEQIERDLDIWRVGGRVMLSREFLPYAPGDKLDINDGEALAVIRAVRIERLQEISFEDCRAEGCDPNYEEEKPDACPGEPCDGRHFGEKWHFLRHWNAIHGPGEQWAVDPFVIVLELEKGTE